MMRAYTLASFMALRLAAAGLIRKQYAHGTCHQFDVAMTAESPVAVYDLPQVDDDLSTVQWALQSYTWSWKARPGHCILENITIAGTYNIHMQLCIPNRSVKEKNVLQIATHGGYYDSRYWDSEYKPEHHSYVYASLAAGYSILTYDRLGNRNRTPQMHIEGSRLDFSWEILSKITKKAREGSLAPAKGWSHQGTFKPNKIVHVGHSFGSVVTTAFFATYPEETDGGIITGLALNQ